MFAICLFLADTFLLYFILITVLSQLEQLARMEGAAHLMKVHRLMIPSAHTTLEFQYSTKDLNSGLAVRSVLLTLTHFLANLAAQLAPISGQKRLIIYSKYYCPPQIK